MVRSAWLVPLVALAGFAPAASGRPKKPVQFVSGGADFEASAQFEMSVADSGRSLVVWTEYRSLSKCAVKARDLSAAGALRRTVTIGVIKDQSCRPAAAFSPTGAAIVAWGDATRRGSSLYFRRHLQTGRWGPRETFPGQNRGVDRNPTIIDLVMDRTGQATVLTSVDLKSGGTYSSALYVWRIEADGTLDAPEAVVVLPNAGSPRLDTGNSSPGSMGVDAAGDVVITWLQGYLPNGSDQLWTSVLTTSGMLSPPQPATPPGDGVAAQVSVSPDGHAAFVWSRPNPARGA
jgi:hypothetical protein